MHISRPWATREGKGIDKNGLRAILGLGLPSKGLGIKDKSCWLGLHSPCTLLYASNREALPPSLLCLSLVFTCLFAFHCCYAYDRFPFTTLTLLSFSFSSPSPHDRVVARWRIRGRCSWHHRSSIIDQLSQGSGEEVSSPSGSCKIPTTREVSARSLNNFWRRCRGGKQVA